MTKLLSGKVIFLTGGSSGIGLACARAYAAEGASLVIASNNAAEIKLTLNELGSMHMGVVCDIMHASQVKAAIDRTLDRFERLDAIHNNAGITYPSKMLHETTADEWDRLMQVNLKGIYHTTLFGFEALRSAKGSILNTSSIVGEIGQELHAAYTATKGGINALTKSMALDYAKYHIRVNAVSPAGVWTPALRKWIREQPETSYMQEYLGAIHPLGYCPEGDVVADTCTFLLSDKARFITGCIMPVSGGAELGYRSILPVKDSKKMEEYMNRHC